MGTHHQHPTGEGTMDKGVRVAISAIFAAVAIHRLIRAIEEP
jgi:ribulose 1,5-bisphosphate carboxylase large subunit-like protein